MVDVAGVAGFSLWRALFNANIGHAAHLGGAVFGLWYVTGGDRLLWRWATRFAAAVRQ